MAAPAPAPSRPFLPLDYSATFDKFSDWGMVVCECESKVAYGCGPLGQQIAEGLTVLADLSYDVPRLAVHVTDEVLRLFEEEVPGKLEKTRGRSISDRLLEIVGTKVNLYADVEVVEDGGLVVFRLSFHHDYDGIGELRSYHLVYDAEAASLCLLPYVPLHCETAYTRRPLPVRHLAGDGYSLVLTAVEAEEHEASSHNQLDRPILCLWTPSHDDGNGAVRPWRIRQRRHATAIPDRFGYAELKLFSYRGKAFWADLTQGILYCECADLLDNGDHAVDFTFVALPEEYRSEELDRHRAMGVGVGDSVWFVVLESCDHPGDTTVVVLSLDLSDGIGERRWERHLELSLLSIWALEGFVKAGLPRRVPRSPFLRDQDTGVIYLFLPPADVNSERGCYLIGIDVRDISQPCLLPPRRLAISPARFNQQNMLLSCDFFDRRRNQEEALISQPFNQS